MRQTSQMFHGIKKFETLSQPQSEDLALRRVALLDV